MHIQRLHPKSGAPIGNASAPNCLPAAVSYYGGPVVSSVNVVTVFWGSSAYSSYQASLSAFYTSITNSAYMDWLSEYDTIGLLDANAQPGTNQAIARGTFGGAVTITPSTCSANCTIDDTAIQTELLNQVNAGKLPAPTTDHDGNVNTAYMIYFPSSVTITLQGSRSCVQFCAYHGTTVNLDAIEGKNLLYGVLPDLTVGGCARGCGANANAFDNITSVSSHELGELITDADVGIAPTVAPPVAWYSNACGEIGDSCNAQDGTVGSYTVQQLWSNELNGCVVSNPNTGPGSGPKYQVVASSGTTSVGTSTAIIVYAGSSQSPLTHYLGTVHFTSSDSSAGLPSDYTFTSSNMGSHGFNVTFNTAGSQTVTATDTNAPEMTGSVTFNVTNGSATHFAVSAPASAAPSVPFNFSVSARDASNNLVSTYSGTVHFTSSDPAAVLPANSTLANGAGTFSASLNTVGTQTISASDTVTTFVTGMASIKVAKLTTTTGLTAKPNPAALGQLVTFTAAVKSASGIPSGTVTLYEGTTVLATGTLDGTGHVVVGISSLPVGAHSIFASYAGNTVYKASKSGLLTETIKFGTTTAITSGVPNPTTYDTPVQLTAHVTSTTTATGNVTFKSGTLVLGTAALDPSDNATITTAATALTGGAHSLTAVYAGDASHMNSTSPLYKEQVNKAATATALSTSATSVPVNTSITFTATVTSPTGLTPPGKVTFKAGTTLLGTVTLNSSGVATLNYGFATAGTYLVKASYVATTNFAASTSTAVTETITP